MNALSGLNLRHQTADAGYDFKPIYEEVHRMDQLSVIAYTSAMKGKRLALTNTLSQPVFVGIRTVMIA